ncbi:hypothetical protein PCE1_004570 [Barthelona sp. PCE]
MGSKEVLDYSIVTPLEQFVHDLELVFDDFFRIKGKGYMTRDINIGDEVYRIGMVTTDQWHPCYAPLPVGIKKLLWTKAFFRADHHSISWFGVRRLVILGSAGVNQTIKPIETNINLPNSAITIVCNKFTIPYVIYSSSINNVFYHGEIIHQGIRLMLHQSQVVRIKPTLSDVWEYAYNTCISDRKFEAMSLYFTARTNHNPLTRVYGHTINRGIEEISLRIDWPLVKAGTLDTRCADSLDNAFGISELEGASKWAIKISTQKRAGLFLQLLTILDWIEKEGAWDAPIPVESTEYPEIEEKILGHAQLKSCPKNSLFDMFVRQIITSESWYELRQAVASLQAMISYCRRSSVNLPNVEVEETVSMRYGLAYQKMQAFNVAMGGVFTSAPTELEEEVQEKEQEKDVVVNIQEESDDVEENWSEWESEDESSTAEDEVVVDEKEEEIDIFEEDEFFSADEVDIVEEHDVFVDAEPIVLDPAGVMYKTTAFNVPITFKHKPITAEEHSAEVEAVKVMDQEERLEHYSCTLRSDMKAFKAANPVCTFEDFLQWFSPRDFDGKASPRMGEHSRWTEIWKETQPEPVSEQEPLWNVEDVLDEVCVWFEFSGKRLFSEIWNVLLEELCRSNIFPLHVLQSVQTSNFETPNDARRVIGQLAKRVTRVLAEGEASRLFDRRVPVESEFYVEQQKKTRREFYTVLSGLNLTLKLKNFVLMGNSKNLPCRFFALFSNINTVPHCSISIAETKSLI